MLLRGVELFGVEVDLRVVVQLDTVVEADNVLPAEPQFGNVPGTLRLQLGAVVFCITVTSSKQVLALFAGSVTLKR